MKRTLAVAAVALLLAAPFARADEASKHAKIEEMLKLTKMDETITKLIDQTRGEISDVVGEQKEAASALPPAQEKIMNDYQDQVTALVMGALKLEDIHPLMVKQYDETYTEAELDGILAFYKTPAGQALLTKSPDLVERVMGLVQQRVSDLGPKIEVLSDQMQKNLAASRGPAGGAAPAAPDAGAKPAGPAK